MMKIINKALFFSVVTLSFLLLSISCSHKNLTEPGGFKIIGVVIDTLGHPINDASISLSYYFSPTLDYFTVEGDSKSTTLEWKSAPEANISAYNIYRSTSIDSVFEKINDVPIPDVGEHVFVDTLLTNLVYHYYKLESEHGDGKILLYGPLSSPFETSKAKIDEEPPRDRKSKYFMLYQNIPSPFVSSTLIRFTIPVNSHSVVAIYDLRKQLVRTLVDVEFEAGVYEIMWNSKDNNWQIVGNGPYIVRMEANDFAMERNIFRNGDERASTDENGEYSINSIPFWTDYVINMRDQDNGDLGWGSMPVDSVKVGASKSGYLTVEKNALLQEGETTRADFVLPPL
jgi:hypothetical protein